MSTKVKISQKNITPFGGAEFIGKVLKDKNIKSVFHHHLGQRSDNARYSYGQLVLDQALTHLCGGSRIEDIEKVRETGLKAVSDASPDTIARAMQELATDNEEYTSASGTKHSFNYNDRLNNLLLQTSLYTGLLNQKDAYCLDYDNMVHENSKRDAQPTYKNTRGYQPGLAFIGKLPVYVCGRNGNSNATYRQADTLERCLDMLTNSGVKINQFRADSASSLKEVISLLDSKGINYYIRYRNSHAEVEYQAHKVSHWHEVHLKNMSFEIGETRFQPFEGSKEVRLIISRIKKGGTANVFSGDDYSYHGIITSDEQSSAESILHFYNQRGEIEKNFDILNNDFNWNYLPFSTMAYNTVYMILTAIHMVLFEWIKSLLSNQKEVRPAMRLKGFIFHFISVSGQWIKRGGQWMLKLFSQQKSHLMRFEI